MDMKTAKERALVMLAFAEGKDIEFYNNHQQAWQYTINPMFETTVCYRVKPNKKTAWINIYKNPNRWTIHYDTEQEAQEAADKLAGWIKSIQIEWEECHDIP